MLCNTFCEHIFHYLKFVIVYHIIIVLIVDDLTAKILTNFRAQL